MLSQKIISYNTEENLINYGNLAKLKKKSIINSLDCGIIYLVSSNFWMEDTNVPKKYAHIFAHHPIIYIYELFKTSVNNRGTT